MKKTLTLLLAITSTFLFAQSPHVTIYGTFLPVNGTSIKEVWDTTNNTMPMPASGTGSPMIWDYSLGVFTPSDTFEIKTENPNSFAALMPASGQGKSTNAAKIRSVKKAITADSIITFYQATYNGLYTVGLTDLKTKIFGYTKPAGTIYEVSDPELVIPFEISDKTQPLTDITIAKASFLAYGSIPVQHRVYRVKDMSVEGYGTLKLPNGDFNNVLLTKEVFNTIDSIYTFGSFYTKFIGGFTRYSFLRNNTFASSVLMFIQDNNADGYSDLAWYTLPTSFGKISGTVYDSDSITALTAGNNEVWLYREDGNFTKNDILAITKVQNDGTYLFDSIPYGNYRIAVRPDTASYPNSLTTYYGNSTDWNAADSVFSIGCTCDKSGINIPIQYSLAQISPLPVTLSGNLNATFPYVGAPENRKNNIGGGKNEFSPLAVKDVKDIDIIVKKQPTGNAAFEIKSDASGDFSIDSLDAGTYTVFVDVPGLSMAQTYTVTVTSGTTNTCLNFDITKDSITPSCAITSIAPVLTSETLLNVYPNPFIGNSTISLTLAEKSNVTIELYNALGAKIYVLENSVKQAGIYSYSIKQENNITPGLYFIKYSTNTEQKVLKLVKK